MIFFRYIWADGKYEKQFATLILDQSCKYIYLGVKCNSGESLLLANVRDTGKSGS